MTDNEIKKSLGCCINNKCSECPLKAMNCSKNVAMAYANDLINRQQADNERLKKLLEEADVNYNKCAKRFYKEAIKEFAKRLNKEAEEVVIDREGDFVFANDKFYESVADWCKETSNNLTKEMVGAYSNETQKETETGK